MQSTELSVCPVSEQALYQVNRFYKRNGHKGRASASDHTFCLRGNGMILAAVRFTSVNNNLLMRGLWVHKDRRGQGLGHRLLEGCRSYWSQQHCYCFAYAHLQDWYAASGFSLADDTTPAQYRQQLVIYQQRGEALVLMQHQPGSDGQCFG
jgi:N-acetylglutamate synthase-like GNAT family acetyltransferase